MFSVDKNAHIFSVAKKIIKGYFFTKINKVKKGLFFGGKMALKLKPNKMPLNKF